MTLPSGYRFLPLDDSRTRDVLDVETWAVPHGTPVDDLVKLPLPLEWERTVGVVGPRTPESDADADADAGELLAVHSSYPFAHFPVPGAEVRLSGLTWVGVHPAHRRRGILRSIIERHFTDCVERGEPVSALFAAESAIYGRFGYGLAASDLKVTVPRGARLRPVTGTEDLTVRIEILDARRHTDLVADAHRRAGTFSGGLNRPGWATRETAALRERHVSDPAALREGRGARRIAIVERDGEACAYATFQRTVEWADGGPRGTVHTREVIALDPAAAHRLWSVLLDLDLTSEVAASMLPTDDVITHLLVNPLSARPRRSDNVWVRLIDVPAALSGRRYVADLDVVLDVTDDLLPRNAGSWRIRAESLGEVEVERTTASPDLRMSVRDLGAAYLDGVTLAGLATADLVTEHTHGALLSTSAAFAWPLAPACSWVF